MLKTIELESQKYWQSTSKQRELVDRKLRRQKTRQRRAMFALYLGTVAILALLFASGFFESVDVVGPLEKIGRLLGIR